MKKINNKLRTSYLVILSALFLFTSCNKDLEQFDAIPTPTYPTGLGVAATIAANPNDSLFNRLIIRAGMAATLNDLTKSYTIFAVDNAGMRLFATAASGGLVPPGAPDAVVSGFIASSLPASSATAIIQYNTIGQKFTAASFGSTFPNYPLANEYQLDPTKPFVRMSIFPLRATPFSYINTMPVTSVDLAAANGIIHHTFSVVSPPSATLRTMINADPTLSFFRAAVLRADSGAVVKPNNPPDSTNFLNYLLGYGVTNMTLLIPNDVAFQNLLIPTITQALIAQGVAPATAAAQAAALASTSAVFSNPALYGALTAATVKGIIAYHFLASNTTPINTSGSYKPDIRVFSVNFPSATPTFVKTLVNSGVAAHPGVMAVATYTGPSVTSLKFSSYGSFPPGGAPFSYTANAIAFDKLAVNGVYHIIDKVLLPQ